MDNGEQASKYIHGSEFYTTELKMFCHVFTHNSSYFNRLANTRGRGKRCLLTLAEEKKP